MAKPHVPGDPNLPLRPLIFDHSPFSPSAAQDRDSDCIDDEAEHVIANHFRPYFVFDSRENARRENEPVVLYRVTPVDPVPGHCDGFVPSRLRIRYAHLYRDDGGFATSWVCNNSHLGDNQAVDAEVTVSPDGSTLRLAYFKVGDESWWPRNRVFFEDEQHAVVYLSAGKHHEYADKAWNGAGYPYYYFGCREGVNGRGARVLSVLESPYSPHGRNNVGEPRAHPDGDFVNDLTLLGFLGENAWGTTPFCGGHLATCSFKETTSMALLWGD